ncbi:unnamed protein product [Haemonchus placei]|uniref:Transposase n=1 Tax=Haemonchus placei TaxID=6290 RepID=A0A0N4W8G6_HAEPC|nr:unnamed protein product [Haemonchus placei]
MLYYFENGWEVAESFLSTNSSAMEQPAKVKKRMRSTRKSDIFTDTNSYDGHVNRSLNNWLGNRTHDDLDDLLTDVKMWIAFKNRNFFACGIRLPIKWEAVLNAYGGYFQRNH